MSFLWPGMLVLLVAAPLVVWGYVSLMRQRAAAAPPSPLGVRPNAAARRRRRVRHIPAVLFVVALVVLFVAFARPERRASVCLIAKERSSSPSTSRTACWRTDLQRLAGTTPGGGQVVRRRSNRARSKIGVVAFNNSARVTQQPTRNGDALAAVDPSDADRGDVARPGHLPSLSAIAGKPLTAAECVRGRRRQRRTSVTTARQPSCCCPTVRTRRDPTPAAVAQLASTAGVHIYPIGIGSTQGTVLQINGFSVATALDEQMLKQIASVTNGTYYNAPTRRRWRRSTGTSTCAP